MSSSASQPLTFPNLISRLIAGEDLSATETAWAMDTVMSGDANDIQVAGFLVALRSKGETADELLGLADAMLGHAVRIEVPGPLVDIVGTGGDRASTVNISTMASLVVAGAGVRVVKHGNRAASSKCGSADVLEALGVRLDLPPERVQELASEVGITFCFAQVFHPAMRYAAIPRRELGVATAFNFLGPLTNPAQPDASAIGVADARLAPLVAGVLAARGTSSLVFRGGDGLDELTTTGPSTVWWVRDGEVEELGLDPLDIGVPRAAMEDLRGADPEFNARVARHFLAGERGPVRDAVLLNAAAALVAAGSRTGSLEEQMAAAMEEAARSVDSGAAADVLDRWIRATE
ncbi:MAG TPA: anthranilate phosphoribosyltransferase [Actinomycetales bacterium]|nr:anthranilate phosphoribosyltransferase [Actinomycetales bacterium]